jgi:pyruvate dehydrogenase E2 component (dihydrolipoamide acetyltransferase)
MEVVILPKLGFNMDEGELVKWNKQIGDPVAKGEILFEINTDKTTMPVESTSDGILLKTMLSEGETADVFTPIAVVGNEGDDADAALASYSGGGDTPAEPTSNGEAQAPASVVSKAVPTSSISREDIKLTPKAKKLIADEGLDVASLANVSGTGFQGGITARDIKNAGIEAGASPSTSPISGSEASPLARKLAERDGVDLGNVAGTGIRGKIMKADVQNAGSQGPNNTASRVDSGIVDNSLKILKTTPYKGVRKIIGDRLAESKFTAPHLYFTDAIDTTNMTAFRKQLNEGEDKKISVSDIFVLAASKALTKYPDINSSLINGEIITYESTNVGVAVAGNNGLIVPVIKNVQAKTLAQVSSENRALVDRALEGKLSPDEYTGGTFSISNLGMFGIGNFTAIINPPESAILSVSSVRKTPVVIEKDGEDIIAIRPMMNVQLTVDHRLIDGLVASQFLACFKGLLENPAKLLR